MSLGSSAIAVGTVAYGNVAVHALAFRVDPGGTITWAKDYLWGKTLALNLSFKAAVAASDGGADLILIPPRSAAGAARVLHLDPGGAVTRLQLFDKFIDAAANGRDIFVLHDQEIHGSLSKLTR